MAILGKSITAGAAFLLMLGLVSGCSATGPSQSALPSNSQKPASSASASDLPTRLPMSASQARAAYEAVAKDSCLAAQNTGELDQSRTITKVMVPKAQAYKDYSAAYLQKPGTFGVIWEIDAFAGCTDWFTFSMAQEAGQEAEIQVTFDATDGSFTAKQDLGSLGVSRIRYGVADGKIASALDLEAKSPEPVTVKYGPLDAKNLKILVTAVDQYLATLK